MRRTLIASTLLALALAVPAVAAAPGTQSVVGHGSQVYESVEGATIHSFVTVSARSDVGGTNPRGVIVVRDISPATNRTQTFHADVSSGCVIVAGNTAIVVGILPESEQFDVPPPTPQPFHITAIGVVVQEVSEQGQPDDLAQPIYLRAASADKVCGGFALHMLNPYVGQFNVEDGLTP